ncbi:MAG: peptidoglycan binding domain-containing protein, partial [Acidimicrobiia bacterium]|nr:peptidoglycan binding domain-containing protein [Acidimicrobiia bacterium]
MTDRPSEGEAAASPPPDISDIIGTGLNDDAPMPPDPAGLDSAPPDQGDIDGNGTVPARRSAAAGTIEAMVDGIEWADSPPADDEAPRPTPQTAGGSANGLKPAPLTADGSIDLRDQHQPPSAPPAPPLRPQRPWADPPASTAEEPPSDLDPAQPAADDPAAGNDDPTAPVPAGGFIVPPQPDDPPLDATQPIDVADLVATQAIPLTEPATVGSNRLLDAVLAVERAEAAARTDQAAGPADADRLGPADNATTPFDPTATAAAPPLPGSSGAGEHPAGDPARAGRAGPSPALIAASRAAGASSGDTAGDTDTVVATPAATPGPGMPDGPVRTGRSRRLGGPLPLVGVGVLAVLALVTAAWGIDSARTDGEVMRGTRLGGTELGGLDRDELATVFDDLDAGLGEAQLTATIGQVTVDTNPAALGAAVDRDRQTDAALAARRGGTAVLRPIRWLASFVTSEDLDPIYEIDPEMAASGAQGVLTAALDQPVDPGMVVEQGELTLSEGRPGVQVDPAEVASALPAALAGPDPYEISLQAVPAEPRYTNDQVQAVVDDANTATSEPIEVRVLDKTAEVDPATMRSWIRLDSAGDEPAWAVDGEAALADLKPLFPSLGSEDERAHFNIVDNVPVIIPASSTIICCTTESVDGIADVMHQPPLGTGEEDRDPERRLAELTPESVGADEGVNELASLGIVEEVSTFTTKHPCCQNRVTNIHRIADIVRGA